MRTYFIATLLFCAGISAQTPPTSTIPPSTFYINSGGPAVGSATNPPLRNDYSGWVGMQISIGAAPLTVSSLGRLCVSGNAASHAVKIVVAGNNSDLAGAAATVNMTGCTAGQFTYGTFPPITLDPGTTYYVVSQEMSMGDQWYDVGPISTTSDATVISGVFFDSGASKWTPQNPGSNAYVPVNFQYTVNAGSPAPFVTGYPSDPNRPGNIYIQDQYFTGGSAYVDANMGLGIWKDMRFGPIFTYDIPAINGFYVVKFDLLEPNKSGPGQRLFTITANGVTSQSIDIFAMTGAINVQTSVTLMAMVGNGNLHLSFQAAAGNAIVSAIEVTPSYIFSGVEASAIRIYNCEPANPPPPAVCIEINPAAITQPQALIPIPDPRATSPVLQNAVNGK